MMELTRGRGTESVPNLQGSINGNAEPGRDLAILRSHSIISKTLVGDSQGFGVTFKEKPDGGEMASIAFVLDMMGASSPALFHVF
jgi:hypothetical protein